MTDEDALLQEIAAAYDDDENTVDSETFQEFVATKYYDGDATTVEAATDGIVLANALDVDDDTERSKREVEAGGSRTSSHGCGIPIFAKTLLRSRLDRAAR